MELTYFLLVLIGIGAGFVQRVSGFGLGIFAMTFMPHFLPSYTAAATISTIFSCVTSPYNALRNRKSIDYKLALPMIIASLITIPVAVRFASAVSADFFKLLLGAMLILLSIYFILFSKRITMRPTVFNGIVSGGLGGILGGLFSTGGPPAVLYLTNASRDKNVYFATIQFYFSFTNLYAIVMRGLNGFITTHVIICACIGLIGCFTGDFIGRAVFNKLNGEAFKLIIYIGMILSGALMLFP